MPCRTKVWIWGSKNCVPWLERRDEGLVWLRHAPVFLGHSRRVSVDAELLVTAAESSPGAASPECFSRIPLRKLILEPEKRFHNTRSSLGLRASIQEALVGVSAVSRCWRQQAVRPIPSTSEFLLRFIIDLSGGCRFHDF